MSDDRYEIVTWRGVRLDRYTVFNLERAEQIAGIRIIPSQGSYNAGKVTQSAGTHDGGGSVDVKVSHLSRAQANRLCQALRLCGFAAWIRETIPGVWTIHVHAVLVGNVKLSRGAQQQVTAYMRGRNGLANNGPDDFAWRPDLIVNAPYGGDIMATTQEIVLGLLNTPVPNQAAPGKVTTLGSMLGWNDVHVTQTLDAIAAVPGQVLDAPIQNALDRSKTTTLRQVASWSDFHVVETRRLIAEGFASLSESLKAIDGVDPAAIDAALTKSFADLVNKIGTAITPDTEQKAS